MKLALAEVRHARGRFLLAGLAIVLVACRASAVDHDNAAEQAAFHEAISAVAGSVVQITQVGGLDRVGKTAISAGPTTGLILSADGYIVSSAFNFAQDPSSIFVRLPSGENVPAKLVARDLNFMLVLLKVRSDAPLPVPVAVPVSEMAVGQWTIALGRTFQEDRVDTSLGVVSALNRMYGRVIQTDANISAANYGGPLVDIGGRVFGVLVPMAPGAGGGNETDELAGAEYYDSGIGFAVPLEQILAMLPQWSAGGDLMPGRLGIGLRPGSPYTTAPVIETIWSGSPADLAGWQIGDEIVAVDGHAVETQAELRFHVRPKYAGQQITVSLRRGDAEEFDSDVQLVDELTPYRHSFLGILPTPAQDQKTLGVVVEAVWPASPAAQSGLKAGDLLTEFEGEAIDEAGQLRSKLLGKSPGKEVQLKYSRDSEETSGKLDLVAQPEEILSATDLPEHSGDKQDHIALEVQSFKLPQFKREAHYLLPKSKDSPVRGLLVWLGTVEEQQEQELLEAWKAVCQSKSLALLVARPEQDSGWAFDDLEYLQQLVRLAPRRLKVGAAPLVLGGQAKAGQLALALALKSRVTLRGVIADNAPLPRTLDLPENSPARLLDVLSIQSQDSPLLALVKHDVERLRESGRPVAVFPKRADLKTPTLLEPAVRAAIKRWMLGLDRL